MKEAFWYHPRVLEAAPNIFDRVPRGLFGPLGDPYAELYWELLASLYLLVVAVCAGYRHA